jgi:hypothetical protein
VGVSRTRGPTSELRNRTETLLDHQTSTLEQASAPVSVWSQRAGFGPTIISTRQILQPQRTVGNRAVTQILTSGAGGGSTIQRHVTDKAYEAMGKRPASENFRAVVARTRDVLSACPSCPILHIFGRMVCGDVKGITQRGSPLSSAPWKLVLEILPPAISATTR